MKEGFNPADMTPLSAILIMFVVVMLLFPPAADAVEFGKDVKVNDNSTNSQEYPDIAVGKNYEIYVVWQDNRNGNYDIYFAKSTDNGTTFQTNKKINDDSTAQGQINPKIAVDGNGNIHVVWADARSGSLRIYYSKSTDGGSTFSTNILVNSSSAGIQHHPSICIDKNNNIYIAWEDTRSGDYDIYVSKSTDGGQTFTSATRINCGLNQTAHQRYPSIDVNSKGNITVVWQDNRNARWDIFAATSTDGGSSFGTNYKVNSDTTSYNHIAPRIVIDSQDVIHMVWQDERNGNPDIYYARSTDAKTFTNYRADDGTGTSRQEYPSIALDTNDKIMLVWQDNRDGTYDIRYAESTGVGSFSSSLRVNNATSGSQVNASVISDAYNNCNIVWQDDSGGTYDIYFDKNQNAPPLPPEPTSPANDSWLTVSRPTFKWVFKDINSSDSQSAFQLQIDNNSDFSSIEYDSGTVASSSASYTIPTPLSDDVWYWRVRTRDQGGAWGPYSTAWIVKIDTQPPVANTPVDEGTWSTSSTLNWTWSASVDAMSGVEGYYVCIGTSPGGNDVVNDYWTTGTNFTLNNAQEGKTYYAKIKAKDVAGNIGSYSQSSDGIGVDLTPPSTTTPSDVGAYTNVSLIKWTWNAASDATSGIAGYYISIGTTPGGTDIINEKWIGNVLTFSYPSGANGVTYYAKVRAKDIAGNIGNYGGNSDGITVDTSIPVAYAPSDEGKYTNKTNITWKWAASWDSPSGIKGYYISIGTYIGGNDVVKEQFVTSTNFTLQHAQHGKTYYARIRAVDNAGNQGPFSTSSDGITVDLTAPEPVKVYDDGKWTTDTAQLKFSWTNSREDISGVAEYWYAIGTSPNSTDVLDWTYNGLNTFALVTNLTLIHGQTYYVTVKAKNGAGMWSNLSSSDGITVDITVPEMDAPTDAGVWATSSAITWNWTPVEDFPSGIRGYYITIGTSPGAGDVLKDVWVPGTSYSYASGINGVTYYAMVRAVDNAGNVGEYSPPSDGITVDVSIPASFTPLDEGVYTSNTTVRWTWKPADDYPSGIKGYYISIGTYPGGDDVLKDFWVINTTYILTNASSGTTYYAKIRAVDGAGNLGPYSLPSDGITVDLTPPSKPRASYEEIYVNYSNEISFEWGESNDDESGIYGYYVGLGTSPGSPDIINWTFVGNMYVWKFTELSLKEGQSYYAIVKAVNHARIESNITVVMKLTVDTTSPTQVVVSDAGEFVNSTVLVWTWTASTDIHSYVHGYFVYIGTSPEVWDVVNGVFVQSTEYTLHGAQHGKTYYASVVPVDAAGNRGRESNITDGVSVDLQPPFAYAPESEYLYSTDGVIKWMWKPAEDYPSGIAGYYISIGTVPGGNDIVSNAWVTSEEYVLKGALNGKTYYASIRAKDKAGNIGLPSLSLHGVYVDLVPPSGEFTINDGDKYTRERLVMIRINASEDARFMKISEDKDLSKASWQSMLPEVLFRLSDIDGEHTVYLVLMDASGQTSEIYSQSIILDRKVSVTVKVEAEVEREKNTTRIVGTAEPGSSVAINGKSVAVDEKGNFFYRAELKEGQNIFIVEIVDPAGNKKIESLSVKKEGKTEENVKGLGDIASAFTAVAVLIGVLIFLVVALIVMVYVLKTRIDALSTKPSPPRMDEEEKEEEVEMEEEEGEEEEKEEEDEVEEEGEEEELWEEMEYEGDEEKEEEEQLISEEIPEEAEVVGEEIVEEVPAATDALAMTGGEGGEDAEKLSARGIYDALYGKEQTTAEPEPAPPLEVEKEEETEKEEEKKEVVTRVRCPGCKQVIPLYTTKRPLPITCPHCGLKGVLR